MSVPFRIIKKAGHEDRYTYDGILIDDFLSAQELRDIYFTLSGQVYKVGQTFCKEFTRKSTLIDECKNLIDLYISIPDVWSTVLENQEAERIEREKLERKNKELVARKHMIKKKVEELSKLTRDEFDILQTAMEIANAYID